MNYQYKNGGTFGESIAVLMDEGGVRRLYSGLPFALLQVPTSRFFDVLSNEVIVINEASVNREILSRDWTVAQIPTPTLSLTSLHVLSHYRHQR